MGGWVGCLPSVMWVAEEEKGEKEGEERRRRPIPNVCMCSRRGARTARQAVGKVGGRKERGEEEEEETLSSFFSFSVGGAAVFFPSSSSSSSSSSLEDRYLPTTSSALPTSNNPAGKRCKRGWVGGWVGEWVGRWVGWVDVLGWVGRVGGRAFFFLTSILGRTVFLPPPPSPTRLAM